MVTRRNLLVFFYHELFESAHHKRLLMKNNQGEKMFMLFKKFVLNKRPLGISSANGTNNKGSRRGFSLKLEFQFEGVIRMNLILSQGSLGLLRKLINKAQKLKVLSQNF